MILIISSMIEVALIANTAHNNGFYSTKIIASKNVVSVTKYYPNFYSFPTTSTNKSHKCRENQRLRTSVVSVEQEREPGTCVVETKLTRSAGWKDNFLSLL